MADYFDLLAARPEHVSSKRYRNSQLEVDRDSEQSPNRDVRIDSAADASKVTITADNAGDASLDRWQVRPKFPATYTNGNIFLVYNVRWGAEYASKAKRTTLDRHKCMNIMRQPSKGWYMRLETYPTYEGIGTSYSPTVPPGKVGFLKYRYYAAAAGGAKNLPMKLPWFFIDPATWTRIWQWVDFRAGGQWGIKIWVADESRAPRLIADTQVQLSTGDGTQTGANAFNFEWNSSNPRAASDPALYSWQRDYSLLRNVSNPDALVDLGRVVP